MSVDPAEIAARVRAEMATYVEWYRSAARPDGLLGTTLPVARIERHLAKMQESLVEPYWLDAEVGIDHLDRTGWSERCLVVADDQGGYLLAYVPSKDNYTALQEYRPGRFRSFGLDGDAVGTFISI